MVSKIVMEQVWARMMAIDGPVIDLEVFRGAEEIERDGLGKTFSEDAMDDLNYRMLAWVGTRVMRACNGGIMPQRMVVTVSVETDIDDIKGETEYGTESDEY